MYKILWKFKKKELKFFFLLFLKGTIIIIVIIKKWRPKVKSGQAGFCFGKRTTLILTGVIVAGPLWLLLSALSCLR